jgi:hypothetical protein
MLSLGMYTVIMCLVIYILCSKIVDIKFSAHDTFLLEKPSSGTLKIERFESGIIQKCSKQSSSN